mmetsp:Transcript_8076/g.17246  ORF Transcript_8076/g.17246 Transcript_8076/m.17246 type:complete len:98 (-) Transcript_8076:330-623(-)
MQIKNYLIALAVTMSVCLLALAMRSPQSTILMQPVISEQDTLTAYQGRPVRFMQLDEEDEGDEDARKRDMHLNTKSIKSNHPSWQAKRVHVRNLNLL